MKLKAKSLVYSVALAMVLAALGALPGAAYAQQYPS